MFDFGAMAPNVGDITRAGKTGNALNFGSMLLGGNAKAMLIGEEDDGIVTFSVNPNSVSVSKQNSVEGNRSVIYSKHQDAIKGTGNVRLNLSNAHLTGAGSTHAQADQLIKWATPVPKSPDTRLLGAMAKDIAAKAAAKVTSAASADASSLTKETGDSAEVEPLYYGLPKLLFTWGIQGPRGSNVPVTLESVGIEYKRFDGAGVPIWATCKLTLVEVHEEKGAQNPTSGGIAGRTKHTVHQGENVVQIANRAYGSPQAWRSVAEVNNLDDPLRVRPGRTLSLPPAEGRGSQ